MAKYLAMMTLMVGLWGSTALGQVAVREDLSATKLPHGEALLPLPMAPEADAGMVLRVSDGKVSPLPAVEVGQTGRDMLQKLMGQRIGDILYPAVGTFIVVAGRVSDLGTCYLFEAAGRELKEPPLIEANPSSPKSLQGTIGGVKEGHVYLIETVEGKFALVRMVKQEPNGAFVQYVAQPDATLKFVVARGALLPLDGAAVAATEPARISIATDSRVPSTQPIGDMALSPRVPVTLAPVPQREVVLEPALRTWMTQRQMMVERRMATVKIPATTEAEIQAKAQAMDELGAMNAAEAVETLMAEISFYNSQARPKQFSIEAFHPAVTALKRIGKPASVAALKAIGTLPLDVPKVEDPLRSMGYKLRLLALVIGGVEGTEVGEFMLTKAGQGADAEHKPLYEQAIGYLKEP